MLYSTRDSPDGPPVAENGSTNGGRGRITSAEVGETKNVY